MDCQNIRDGGLLQNFIYLMNDFSTRNEIMAYHLRHTNNTKRCRWMGTWVVRKKGGDLYLEGAPDPVLKQPIRNSSITALIQKHKKKFKESVFVFFTVCILYETNLVHYVSFMYDSSQKRLLSFDPGVELYHQGQDTIVPLVQKAFEAHGLIQGHSILGACSEHRFKNKKYGVQYNGKNKNTLPADAFCQSWTLFFFVRVMYIPEVTMDRVHEFVGEWCKIPPSKREHFITSFFIIPVLTYFPNIAKRYEEQRNDGLNNVRAVERIFAPVERCFFTKKH